MSSGEFDAVVVGAGPNGLVAAITLARHGRRVLLLEAAERVGGALRSEALTLPGFVHDVGATVLPLALASPAFADLAAELPGDLWAQPDLPCAHPLDGGAGLVSRDLNVTAAGFGPDARAWRLMVGGAVTGGARLTDALLSPSASPGRLVRATGPLLRVGAAAALPASVLARAFRTTEARAVLAGLAAHSTLPLHRATSAGYGILLASLAHRVGWPVVRGGSEQLAGALATVLRRSGGLIETGVTVHRLDELPPAGQVLLDVAPRQLLELAGDRLPPRYCRLVSRFRHAPGVFKLDWALDGPVPWRDGRLAAAGTVHLGGTFAEIAHSEREVARGRHPRHPYVIAVQASVPDPSRAPAGKHTLWAYCHVPNGSPQDMTAPIEAAIERAAPGFRDLILARHAMPPAALERFDANLVGGDVNGGAADLRRLLARPVLSPRPWRTPLTGVYLCSASTPPGGGVHGMAGWLAARTALRDAGRGGSRPAAGR